MTTELGLNEDILEGEDMLNLEDLDEKEVLGDDEEDKIDGLMAKKEIDGDDLYDAAIEPSGVVSEKRESTEVQSSLPNSAQQRTIKTEPNVGGGLIFQQPGKRYCCYVGNMTWWTTDAELGKIVKALGIDDLIDVKFYENRNNGQSKGFALTVFGSENSVKTVMDKLPNKKLHEQTLVVLPYTKQSLAKLEEATKRFDQKSGGTNPPPSVKEEKVINIGTIRIGANGAPVPQLMSSINLAQLGRPVAQPQVALPPTSLLSLNFAPPANASSANPAPVQHRPPQPSSVGLMTSVAAAPPGMNAPAPPHANLAPAGMPTANMMQPQQQYRTIGQMPGGIQQQAMQPQSGFPPGAHINPQMYPAYAHNTTGGYGNIADGTGAVMSEGEFQEIMNRNQTVSSSAIHRAVSDAASGDYASAIETLITAISLIRQSRVAHDDRCKLLINTLQDTLNGIEAKSYSSGGSRKHRRERSRSPIRTSKRHRRSHSRSRSRERGGSSYEYSPLRHSMSRRY